MYELPIFPLNTVLFPGMPLHLRVFESRYQLMVRRCLEGNRNFGVALIRQGVEACGPLAKPYMVGTTARIIQIEPLEDGCFNLTALGMDRFRILKLSDDQPYLVGEIETLPLEKPHNLEILRGARTLSGWVKNYLALLKRANDTELLDLSELQLPDEPLVLIYLAASLLHIPSHEKQPLLAADSACHLLQQVQRLYRRETALLEQLLQSNQSEVDTLAGMN